MRVLQICYKPPYPPVDGGTMGMHCITKGLLSCGHEVKVLTVSSAKHPVKLRECDEEYRRRTEFESVEIDLSIHPVAAAVALLCGESYNVKRFESKAFGEKIESVLRAETYDMIQVESIFLAPYLPLIRRVCKTPVVMRAHNVEYRIWKQLAQTTKEPLKRWYLKKLALSLRAYELEKVNDFDGIICVSENDAAMFRSEGCRRPIMVRPFGIDPIERSGVAVEAKSLFHIGAMDWQPNIDGVKWFLQSVWPLLHKELPEVRLYLAGRKMPDELKEAQIEGVEVVGEVADSAEFIASKQINVVPLLAGSGIRVKIIEAMELGKTVIATTTAADGIEYVDGEELLIADTPEQFVEQVRRCIAEPEMAKEIGEKAHRLVRTKYDNNVLTERMTEFYNKIIEKTLL